MENTKIKSISMGSVYAEDYKESYDFYNGVLGLDDVNPMGDAACYFNLGDEQGLYLEGGYEAANSSGKYSTTTFTFQVGSASEMFKKLKSKGVRIIHKEPMKMGENIFWFQCYDPSKNIVEFLGGE